jgi:hypothetical protein
MRRILSSEADRARFIATVNTLEFGKKRFIAEVKVYRKQRSMSQNKLYFMWLHCISNETGNDVDTLHEFFKKKFLPWKSVAVFDDEVLKATSTTVLDTKEFSEYIDKIKEFSAGWAIELPNPGDQGYEQLVIQYGNQ